MYKWYSCIWSNKIVMFKKYLLCTLSRSRLVQTRHYRSSFSQIFFKIDVLKNFANLTAKHQCWSLTCNFIKNRCFPVKFANFLRTPFLPNTSAGCFWTNPVDLCGSFGKGIFWSFSLSLHWLSYIMLNLLTKSSFDISLLFKLHYAAILLILWIVNKPCYNDSTFARSEKVEMISTFLRNRYFRKVSVNKTFTHVQEQKKAMLQRHSAYIPSSVKSP